MGLLCISNIYGRPNCRSRGLHTFHAGHEEQHRSGPSGHQGAGSGGQGRNGGGARRPAHDGRVTSLDRDELPRSEAAVRNPREKQPIIVHKGSRLDRFPSAEQLDELSNSTRPRSEKPALLTRNREE